MKLLKSYLVVLIVPFAAISVMYYNAQSRIREEIIASNANNLHQFLNVVDMKLANMSEKAIQILSNVTIREQSSYYLDSNQSSGYDIFRAKKYLVDIPMEDYYDVFVYYNSNDRIISATNSSLHCEDYFTTYYQASFNKLWDSDSNFETFYSALTPKVSSPQLVLFGQDRSTPSLGVVLSQNIQNSLHTSDMTAVLILRPELLANLLQNATFGGQGSIMMYDHNNNLLVSSRSNESVIDISKYSEENKIYSDSFDGEKYVLQSFKSSVLDCTYVSAIPVNIFWEKLYGLRTISLISILLSMIASVVLTWMLARHSYSPITSIIHTICDNSNIKYDFKKPNEMEFIGNVIKNSLAENDMLSSSIETSNNNLWDDFLLHAMQGTLAHNKDLKRETQSIDLNFISDSFTIMLIHVDTVNELITGSPNTDEGQQMISFIFSNIMLELCRESHQGFVVGLVSQVYAVILNFSLDTWQPNKENDALKIGRDFQKYLTEYFEITCTVSVSLPENGIHNMNIAYNQAVKAMEYRYLMGKGSIIPYKDILGKKFYYNNSSNARNAQILIQYVKDNIENNISEILDQIIDDTIIGEDMSLNSIECFKYDFINIINKIIFDIGAVDFEKEHNFIQLMICADTFAEFKENLKLTLDQLRAYRITNTEQFTICDRAEEFIHKSYMDINLNNSIIAEKMDISPSYLSKLFKTQKGISLMDYLYQIRISNAKTFLKETSLTVEEIACKTGFISNSALIKTFKKHEGITPGSYRKVV